MDREHKKILIRLFESVVCRSFFHSRLNSVACTLIYVCCNTGSLVVPRFGVVTQITNTQSLTHTHSPRMLRCKHKKPHEKKRRKKSREMK